MLNKLNVHYLQHASFEGLGMMEDWFLDRGHRLSRTAFYRRDWKLPPQDEFDLLVVMGGPQSVYEEAQFPWLKEEKSFIRLSADSGKPILGICLGAQLLVSAFGGRVYPNSEKEIGWFPVSYTSQAQALPWFAPDAKEETVFHWHGDTFDLPNNAVLLASSPITPHQAFLLGDKVLGLQYHLETNRKALEAFIANDEAELIGQGNVQTPEQVRSGVVFTQSTAKSLDRILSRWEFFAQNL